MQNFTNSVLLPENLPQIESTTFNRLDKKYLTILYIRQLFFFLFMAGSVGAYWIIAAEEVIVTVLYIAIPVIIVLSIWSIIVMLLGFSRKGYLVRENDISYQRGLITFKVISIPFNRIQHVEVNQGIIAKLLHLSSIKIFTAGGTASDLSIPGIHFTVAQNLKSFLTDKINEHE